VTCDSTSQLESWTDIQYGDPMADPRYLTRDETAALLRIGTRTVDRLADEGKLTRHHVGGRRGRTLFREDQVLGLVQPETST
jgi:excisionase family DNA binding protein